MALLMRHMAKEDKRDFVLTFEAAERALRLRGDIDPFASFADLDEEDEEEPLLD